MSVILNKFKEVLLSVLPITLIVVIMHLFLSPVSTVMLWRFLLGALYIIIGLTIFLFGVDIGVTPLGENVGATISKQGKIWFIVVAGLIVGFFISIAEPDLQVLAAQVASVTGGIISNMAILISVSAGIAVMLVLGLIRIVYNVPLYKMLTVTYAVIGVLSFFVSPEFLAISFDASGATTGALTVPFILALAVGISAMKRDSKSSEKDSFGLVAITSSGAIIGVLILGILSKTGSLTGEVAPPIDETTSFFTPFKEAITHVLPESLMAFVPILIIFIVFQFAYFHFTKRQFRRILKGIVYAFIGLVLFLTGVNAGFMDVGTQMGQSLTEKSHLLVIAVGFLLGFVTILAEPAVHVLTSQIEMVTSGFVKKSVVLGALCIGVGAAGGLSVLRIITPSIQLWHYLLPGYIICIALSYFTPKLFVGMAFDSGGVASGPITATFILAFVQGVASAAEGANVLTDAFGMIALVAMMPIITLQILGLIVKIKSRKSGVKIGE